LWFGRLGEREWEREKERERGEREGERERETGSLDLLSILENNFWLI
jgi:hypothetical protein